MDETQTTGDDAPVKDTADTQTSEATVQTNNEAPEESQAAEGKQAEDVKTEDTAEEKLYAGKYKTPDEMEKAYKELESKFGQTTSEKAELTRILNEAFNEPEPGQAEVQGDDYVEPTSSTADDGVKRDLAVMKFIMAHGDADATSMKDVLNNDPYVSQIASHEAKLEYAYLRSQNMSQSKAIAEAKKAAASETQAKVVEKQAAQVESGRKAEENDEDSNTYGRATGNYSQEDRDQARKEWVKKNLVNL